MSKPLTPGLTFIQTNKPNVMAFQINGVVTAKELPEEIEKFESFLKQHESVRMLARFKHFAGFDPAVFFQSGFVSVKLAAVQKLERYAVVGAPEWMNKIMEIMNPLFSGIDMRTFTSDEEAKAWAWLEAEPS